MDAEGKGIVAIKATSHPEPPSVPLFEIAVVFSIGTQDLTKIHGIGCGVPSRKTKHPLDRYSRAKGLVSTLPDFRVLLLSAYASGLIMYSVLYSSGRNPRFQLASRPRA